MPETDRGCVFLIDDEEDMRKATAQWLELAGYEVCGFESAVAGLNALDTSSPRVVVTDVKMPQMDGMALLSRVSDRDSDLPVVLVTAHGDVQMAVEAIRLGAYDFIEKPFEPERLLDVVQRACEKRRLVLENRDLRRRLSGPASMEQQLIGNCPAIQRLRQEILDVAATDAPVLVLGETGTGKEVVARCLHDFSQRSLEKYVAVNCGAVPEPVFESELFGHERGAFTGADRRRVGRFEYADRGTLFLDEIASMPLSLQVKVLRTLQEREVVRLGANEPRSIDVRLVSSANTDLREEARVGRFREDLYYRLNVVELRIPPLRTRDGDILLLFDVFVARAAESYGRDPEPVRDEETEALLTHDWPGNVRELKNIAERFVLSSRRPGRRLAGILGQPLPDMSMDPRSLADMLRRYERCLLEQSLARNQGNVQAVMEELGLPRRTLNEKLARYGLERKDFV